MFATLSRGSSRVRNAYICSSCLSNALGHAEPQTSRFLIDHAARPAVASFSTTSINRQAEENGDKDQGVSGTASWEGKGNVNGGGEVGGKETVSVSPLSITRAGRLKRRRVPLQISTSKETLDALKASMLAEEEVAITTERASATRRAFNRRKRKEIAKKASQKKTEEVAVEPVEITVAPDEVKGEPSKPAKLKKPTAKGSISKTSKESASAKKAAKTEKPKAGDNSKKDKTTSKTPSGTSTKSVKKTGLVKRTNSKTPPKKGEIQGEKDGSPLKIKRIDTPTTYQNLIQQQKDLIRSIQHNTVGGAAMRQALIKIIQDGRLSKEDTGPAVKLLRSTLLRPSISNAITGFQSLKAAMQGNPVARKQSGVVPFRVSRVSSRSASPPRLTRARARKDPGPVVAVRGMTAHEIKTIDAEDLKLTPLDNGPLEVPNLSYGLERVLFNPGVYHLQDPRSRVFNFDPYLQSIMPVSEFDFNALKQYITSSRDKSLLSTAVAEKKKYTGSTSSMTSALAHFHFLLSQWRPINTGTLSQNFPVEYNSFTSLQRGPVAIFLRWRDGTYAIDADKQFDTANILSMLGKSMEKLLTLPTEDFEKYRKQNSDQISEEERNEDEAFHYTTMGDFLMRSQLDAHDPRLPGTGMFDLKTRAVVSIRMDTSQYEEGSGYEIRSRHGEWESFEREYYDMIRAAFLKYSLQVRMGRMDGIFVAFHNTERIFGFQYISLPEMDYALHGTDDVTTGDSEFKLSLELMNRVLDRATAKFPEKSLRIHFETRDAGTPFMYIFAEPVEEEQIEEIQATNKAEIEEFESKVLGLAKESVSEDQRKAEWDSLRAKVEESMEQDELGPTAGEEDVIEDEHSNPEVWDEVERRQVEELLSAATQEDGSQEDEDEVVEDEELDEHVKENENSKDENIEESHDEHQEELNEQFEDPTVEEQQDGAEEASEASEVEDSEDISDTEHTDLVENEDLTPEEESAEADEEPSETPAEDVEDNLAGISPPQTHTIIDPEGPIFAMTLTIRNKVNGQYVDRPTNLTADDKWTVEYALAEVPEAHRARALYEMAKRRRSKILSKAKDNAKDDAWNNQYIENIKKLSRKGREWRKNVESVEKDAPRKVLDVRDDKETERKHRDVWEQEVQGGNK